MPYITVTEVRAGLLPNYPKGETYDAVLEASILRAQAEVDARLASQYPTPFAAPIPGLVRSLVADLAAEGALLATPGANSAGLEKMAAGFRERAERMLEALGEGKATLPGVSGTGAALGAWHRADSSPVLRRFALYEEP